MPELVACQSAPAQAQAAARLAWARRHRRVSCQHMNSDKGWPLREAHRLVDDGIDLELVGEPRAVVVARVRPHANRDTVRNGILQGRRACSAPRHHHCCPSGPADNRRKLRARSFVTSKTICAHTGCRYRRRAPTTSSSAIVGSVHRTANKVSAKKGLSRCQDDDG